LNNNHINRTINLDDTVPMTKAEAKHEELVEDDQCKIANQKDDAVMALQTQVKALSTKLATKKKPKEGGKQADKKKKVPTWMVKPPKNGESKTKNKDGKTYHWCEGYGSHKPRWVIHKVEKCHG